MKKNTTELRRCCLYRSWVREIWVRVGVSDLGFLICCSFVFLLICWLFLCVYALVFFMFLFWCSSCFCFGVWNLFMELESLKLEFHPRNQVLKTQVPHRKSIFKNSSSTWGPPSCEREDAYFQNIIEFLLMLVHGYYCHSKASAIAYIRLWASPTDNPWLVWFQASCQDDPFGPELRRIVVFGSSQCHLCTLWAYLLGWSH